MDRTEDFHRAIDALGQTSTSKKKTIFPQSSSAGPIMQKAKELNSSVVGLQAQVKDEMRSYLALERHAVSSPLDDSKIQSQLNTINEGVVSLKQMIDAQQGLTVQTHAHYQGIILFLFSAVHSVSNALKSIHATRLSKVMAARAQTQLPLSSSSRQQQQKSKMGSGVLNLLSAEELQRASAPPEEEDEETKAFLSRMSPKQRQILESENQKMHSNLNSMMDDVREAEQKVSEVSRLCSVLWHTIEEQAEMIDSIYSQAMESAENVRKGNKEISHAAKGGVFFRVFVLVFFLVMTLGLLFLDWFYSKGSS